jgi:hypothetical protein
LASAGDSEAAVLEACLEHPVDLGAGCKLNTRVVVTGWVTDVPGRDNRDAAYVAGTGELSSHLFFIAPAVGDTGIGPGLRDDFGIAGRYFSRLEWGWME